MTNLTEQFKKGELTGEYWCEITESPYPERVYLPTCDKDIIVEVLAPVPSYDEWKNTTSSFGFEHKANIELIKENEKLKTMLGECLAHLTIGEYGTSVTPINILCDEIKEVLK